MTKYIVYIHMGQSSAIGNMLRTHWELKVSGGSNVGNMLKEPLGTSSGGSDVGNMLRGTSSGGSVVGNMLRELQVEDPMLGTS